MKEITLTKETEIDKRTFKESIWYWVRTTVEAGECFRELSEAENYFNALMEYQKIHGTTQKQSETLKTFPI